MARQTPRYQSPTPPPLDHLPLVHTSAEVAQWLEHYWHKLNLPHEAAARLAVTTDRQEFAVWTGRRLNPLALGCYCYLPNASGGEAEIGCGQGAPQLNSEPTAPVTSTATRRLQPALPGFDPPSAAQVSPAEATLISDYRHLIFVEPDLLPVNIEVTVAHELIHLRDRVTGNPRKHRCHGYDAISVDEAVLTERDPEFLRAQLREETHRREAALRAVRPYRYIYVCPVCKREYPRVRRYSRPVSCGRCDRHYNLAFVLELRDVSRADPSRAQTPARTDGALQSEGAAVSSPANVVAEAS